MSTEEKIKLYGDVKRAFDSLGAVLFPNDERRPRGMSQQLLDACEGAMAGLSIHIAQLESEIGTDNL
jgi:hypothetical protein